MLLLDTLPMLGNVLLLCFFVFFIFGIVGVQLWAGLLRQRCVLQLPDNATVAWCVLRTRLRGLGTLKTDQCPPTRSKSKVYVEINYDTKCDRIECSNCRPNSHVDSNTLL